MNPIEQLTASEKAQVDNLVAHYKGSLFLRAERLANALFDLAGSNLNGMVHSLKKRAKDPEHLRDKLARKLIKARGGESISITPENLFEKINDLAGLRILHLHTSQFPAINSALTKALEGEEYEILEGPVARIWDDEYKEIFAQYGIETQSNPRLYTSVHYVVASGRKTLLTAEIQVRTLAEELWGEVDHAINYPHPTLLKNCQEQIKVLARVTSGCTRLVDSIFFAREEGEAPPQFIAPVAAPQFRKVQVNRTSARRRNRS